MQFKLSLGLLVLLPSIALCTPLTTRGNYSIPPPSQDPFYSVPSDIENKPPGTILAHRRFSSPVSAFGYIPDNLEDSHQVLYRTTDRNGRPTATVMTVLIPKNANFSAVLSLQLAENAIIIDCAPSYAITAATKGNPLLFSPTAQVHVIIMQAALADGWVVVVPDFQGPNAAFADLKIAGQAILDGLRASLRSTSFTGIKESAILAVWGYSAGAAVTKHAAEMHPKYAKELALVAVAYGAVGTPSLSATKKLNKSPHAGLIPPALIGVAQEDPGFQAVLDLNLKQQFKEKFYSPLHQCLDANIKTFENDDIMGMFTCWDMCVLPSLIAAGLKYIEAPSVPVAPVYWYQDTLDEVATIDGVDAAVKEYCRMGAKVHYQRDDAVGVGHRNYGIIGAPNALSFLKDAMHGNIPSAKCSTETDTISDLPDSFLNVFPL